MSDNDFLKFKVFNAWPLSILERITLAFKEKRVFGVPKSFFILNLMCAMVFIFVIVKPEIFLLGGVFFLLICLLIHYLLFFISKSETATSTFEQYVEYRREMKK